MAALSAFPGLFFCFVAMVLLIFVSVSAPTWHAVSFLKVGPEGADQLRFGVFGYTGSGISVGYNFPDPRVNSNSLHRFTYLLIFHPIAAGLCFFSVAFGLCGLNYHRFGTVFMTFTSGLAFILSAIALGIDLYTFGLAKKRYNEFTTAKLGNAVWLTLGAFLSLVIASIVSCLGIFGKYRRKRSEQTTAY